jgi:hypothetical protein
MIDLTRTEEHMLAEIRANAPEETRFVLNGRTPDEMLPTLMETFATRYTSLPSERVYGELGYLVKKGLGNAYKWGNGCAPGRALTVRAVMTDVGAVVAIADEGNGFEVSNVLSTFLQNGGYSRHGGSGFVHFHEAGSLVSYADGGRTLLIRFLCSPEAAAADAIGPTRAASRSRPVEDLAQLTPGTQVKVKGAVRPDGRFVAEKVALKKAEEFAVIDGVIQKVETGESRITLLNTAVTLTDSVEIWSPERQVNVDQLREGQATARRRYSQNRIPAHQDPGAARCRPRARRDSGKVESVSQADATFVVLGVMVATDHQTQLKDKRFK